MRGNTDSIGGAAGSGSSDSRVRIIIPSTDSDSRTCTGIDNGRLDLTGGIGGRRIKSSRSSRLSMRKRGGVIALWRTVGRDRRDR